jgi:predicted membrane protein DUF2231
VLITVGGLPAHPLLLHAVVVLVPLTTLAALAVAIRGPWRRGGTVLVALGAVVCALTAFLTMEAGEQLLTALSAGGHLSPDFGEHDKWGTYTWYATIPFAVLAVVTAVLARRGRPAPAHSAGTARTSTAATSTAATTTAAATTGVGTTVLAWLTVLAGIAACVFTVLAGDSGSRAVWGFLTGG